MSESNTADREFRISRVFDAPRDLVWTVWTDPKHMVNWWGPANFSSPLCELDLRVGGAYRFVMRAPDGLDLPVKGQFLVVEKPSRLVMVMDHSELPADWHDMIDPDRPKGQGTPAINLHNTVTFEDLGGRTRLTLAVLFESAAQRAAFLKIGMSEGWNSSLDRFGAEVEKSK